MDTIIISSESEDDVYVLEVESKSDEVMKKKFQLEIFTLKTELNNFVHAFVSKGK